MRARAFALLLGATAIACSGNAGGPDASPDAAPVWSTCPGDPRATPESLAAKAATYEARMLALHVTAEHPWVLDVVLAPGVDPTTATAADVVAWRSGENDGLWTGLALAAEAYRYGATREPAALAAVRTLLAGERTRMAITGVPGLFTRQLIPPGASALTCPGDPADYVPDPMKRANRWVRIGADGCVQTADPSTLAFASTTHCGLDAFRGWCFLDNISQDEYVGHMFGLAAAARLVDDAATRADAVDLLDQIGTHLITHGMEFIDWDGRATRWGKIHPGADGDSNGYLAIMAMSFLAVAADATGDPALVAAEADGAATNAAYLDEILIWNGPDACLSNWNDVSMLAANFHHLLWHVEDPARRELLAGLFDTVLMRPPTPRGALGQHNAWFDVMWAAQKPREVDIAYGAVEDAVCMLRQFPASNHGVAHPGSLAVPHACDDRSGQSLAATPYETADRCAATYLWWQNPYWRDACADDPTLVWQPTGYLLPYWMGRYYGVIAADI